MRKTTQISAWMLEYNRQAPWQQRLPYELWQMIIAYWRSRLVLQKRVADLPEIPQPRCHCYTVRSGHSLCNYEPGFYHEVYVHMDSGKPLNMAKVWELLEIVDTHRLASRDAGREGYFCHCGHDGVGVFTPLQ